MSGAGMLVRAPKTRRDGPRTSCFAAAAQRNAFASASRALLGSR
jgi:hypothetical protein